MMRPCHAVCAVLGLAAAAGCLSGGATGVNDTLGAVDDSASVNEDAQVVIAVLANDTAPAGGTLEIVSFTQPANGTVTDNGDGTLTCVPQADFNGSVSFTYTIGDGSGATDTGTVTVSVVPVNDAPTFLVGPDQTCQEDAGACSVAAWATAMSVGPANESAQTVSFLVTSDAPALFSAQPAVAADGTLTFTPGADANGSSTVTVRLRDSGGTSNGGADTSGPQTFTITVNPVPDPPVAVGDTASVAAGSSVDIPVLDNDSDPDGDPLVIEGFTQPADGVVTSGGDGTLTWTAAGGFTGILTFDYTIGDGTGLTDTATVAVLVGVTLQLGVTEARGLFKPDAVGVGVYQPGYASDDDAGRIYSNRVYVAADPGTTVWTKNKQYVDLAVEVSPADILPAGARVVWEIEDPDDPSNEDPLAHPTAGPTLDPNDYDGVDNDLDGTADNSDGADNTGARDAAAVWEEVHADYALSAGNETALTGGTSKVRFNATDDGGDNFIVRAALRLTPGTAPVATTETGVMTVWKRVDVEYAKMASATPLDGLTDGAANEMFAAAFVEVVAHERAVADVTVGGKLQMGVNEYSASQACDAYVTAAGGEFQHEGQPGWFFSAAANHFVDTTGAGAPPLIYVGWPQVQPDGLTLEVGASETFADDDKYAYGMKTGNRPQAGGYRVMKTDMVFPQADLYKDGTILYDYNPGTDTFDGDAPVMSHTKGAVGNGAEISYAADADAHNGDVIIYKVFVSAAAFWKADTLDRYVIFRYSNFSWDPYGGTFGVWPKSYSTPAQGDVLSFDVIDHGFPALSLAPVTVMGTGALYVTGISPGPNGGLEGRTIVFTASDGDLPTLIHEFGHAFGFHHLCGNWDYRSDDTTGHACTMHYDWYFMLDHSTPRRLNLWTTGYGGPYFCEEHAVAIRRQNLEDLAVLGWGD